MINTLNLCKVILMLDRGSDITIAGLAQTIAKVIDYKGAINFDASKPDGAPRKWMDSSRLRQLGWVPKIDLIMGLRFAYDIF